MTGAERSLEDQSAMIATMRRVHPDIYRDSRPRAVETRARAAASRARAGVAGCRWTTTLPFHLTLAFLGDVPNRDVDEICQVVAGVERRTFRAF